MAVAILAQVLLLGFSRPPAPSCVVRWNFLICFWCPIKDDFGLGDASGVYGT